MAYQCPYCHSRNAAQHTVDCEYYRINMLNAGVPQEVTMQPSVPPGKYRVRGHAICVTNAGRAVRLVLEIKNDLTPSELWALNDLMFDRVEGNIMAYILDEKLIRHFREEPIPEPSEVLKREITLPKQMNAAKNTAENVVFWDNELCEFKSLTIDTINDSLGRMKRL